MAEGRFPNRNRADNALTIYRDAMRGYIAPILEREHGPNWIRSQVLTDDVRERNPNSYTRREQSLKKGVSAQNLIDLADIPFLIRDNSTAFPDLRRSDINRMHQIRELRNKIQHPDREGDCTDVEAAEVTRLCISALDACGLAGAVQRARGVASITSGTEVELTTGEEEHKRTERDRAVHGRWGHQGAAKKRRSFAQGFAENVRHAHEQWERLERERDKIVQFGDDVDGLLRWFTADEARRSRHASAYEPLKQREQELQERERDEIVQFGDDVDGLLRWFNTDETRRSRHTLAYESLKQREQELRERECEEIAQLRDDIGGLRRWFDTHPDRKVRNAPAHATLERRERGRSERIQRERVAIAKFGDDIAGLRRWFNILPDRRKLHADDYSILVQKEHDRAEIAEVGGDLDELGRQFDADSERSRRHKSAHAEILRRERELHKEERTDEPAAPAKRPLFSRIFRRR